jgi:hypothetical protein
VQETRIPTDLVALAASDDRAQVVVDTLARDTREPIEDAHVALEKRLGRHVEGEARRLGARIGQRAEQRVDPALAARDLRPRRQLQPVELQHLAGAVTGPLSRAPGRRTQLAQPSLDQIDRALVAVAVAQHVSHPRRLDLGPLLERRPDHRLESIELRALRRASVSGRLLGLNY